MADFRRLHRCEIIGRQHRAIGGQRADNIEMNGWCIEHRRPTGQQGMACTVPVDLNGTGKADFAHHRIFDHRAARRRRTDLQAPARAERRCAGAVDRLHQLDLLVDFRPAVIDMQRGSGQHHTVIPLELGYIRPVEPLVGHMGDVAHRVRLQGPEDGGIGLGRCHAIGPLPVAPPRGIIAFHYQKPQSHCPKPICDRPSDFGAAGGGCHHHADIKNPPD